MTTKQRRISLFIGTCGVFLLLDQYAKHWALANQDISLYLIKPWLGWEFFANPGITFGIPVPNALLILITPLILLFLAKLLVKEYKKRPALFSFALILIINGAISNYIDRVLYSITIDYIRIITSVINIADVMIIAGALLLLFSQNKYYKKT